MDLQTEQAVWRRVRGPGGVTAREALLPEKLEALILEEQSRAQELRALSGRMNGPQRGRLSRIAARSEARSRSLGALHYLLTGRRLRLQKAPLPRPAPTPEALRQAALSLREAVRSYESLAREFEDYAQDFSRYADETRSQLAAVTDILQSRLTAER